MFDRISGRYDTLNHVLSARRDLAWRRTAVGYLPTGPSRILDLCGGTGDFLLAARASGREATGSVVADFAFRMMLPLPSKGIRPGIQADALQLPFHDASFDAVLCGFGMRNLDRTGDGAAEILRVLKPGGTFVTLEFFRPQTPVSRFFYGAVAPLLMPAVGTVFGSSKEAYEYLVRSIRAFLPVDEYAALLERTGFVESRIRGFDFGLCHAVAARKP
jgi:demethylmenaquinone methyltransferase/2-methoxy-6-polyprenyl-1,4-benzoquinol methylase